MRARRFGEGNVKVVFQDVLLVEATCRSTRGGKCREEDSCRRRRRATIRCSYQRFPFGRVFLDVSGDFW